VDEGTGFALGEPVDVEVTADAAAQVFGLADVDDGAMGVLVEVDAGEGRKQAGAVAQIGEGIYTLIVSRVLLATVLLSVSGFAQQSKPPATPPPAPTGAPQEAEPPEEDESIKPKEYTLNPLQAVTEINVGDQHFKKGKYSAAVYRYLEASRWDPGSAEAFLKLGGAYEKLRDFSNAREAFGKFFELAKDDAKWTKEVDPIKKRMAKWPGAAADSAKTDSAKK
jgi:tetratricopeptide (TPR) repeat protein